jgi:hypothetical protein
MMQTKKAHYWQSAKRGDRNLAQRSDFTGPGLIKIKGDNIAGSPVMIESSEELFCGIGG